MREWGVERGATLTTPSLSFLDFFPFLFLRLLTVSVTVTKGIPEGGSYARAFFLKISRRYITVFSKIKPLVFPLNRTVLDVLNTLVITEAPV